MSSLNKTSPDIEMRKLSEFPFEYLKRNYFIDIKETSGTNWLIGRIIDLNSEENVLKVRCEGMRQELKIKLPSDRIAPFRMYSKGYLNGRNHLMNNINEEQFNEFQNLLEQSICGQIPNISPYQLTQEFRGNFYFYIDQLNNKGGDESGIIRIYSVLGLFIKFSAIFLEKISNMTSELFLGIINPNLSLEKIEIAYTVSIYEILEGIIKLFSNKYLEAYKEYNSLKEEIQQSVQKLSNTQTLSITYDSLLELFLLLFIENNGLKSIIKLIIKFPYGPENEIGNNLSSLWKLLDFLLQIIRIFSENNLLLNNQNIYLANKLIFDKLKNLSDKEIKELDKDLVLRIHKNLLNLNVISLEELETLELEIYKKYINSQYFEKRLKALNDIKDFLERIRSNNDQNHFYTPEKCIQWLLDNKIIENTLRNCSQIDLIKRVFELIRYLLKINDCFPFNIIDLLWNSMSDVQYEDIQICYQEFFEELSNLIDLESIDYIYEKINNLSLNRLNNECFFQFIKKFIFQSTIRTKEIVDSKEKTIELASIEEIELSPLQKKAIDSAENDEKFTGFLIFWKLIGDNSLLNCQKIIELIETFRDLLEKIDNEKLFYYYFKLTIENIINGSSLFQSCSIITKILMIINEKWSVENRLLFIKNCEETCKKGLVHIIIDSMIFLHSDPNGFKFEINEIYKMELSLLNNIRKFPERNTNFFNLTNEEIEILWSLSISKPKFLNESIELVEVFIYDNEVNSFVFKLFCDLIEEKLNKKVILSTSLLNSFFRSFYHCNFSKNKIDGNVNCIYIHCQEEEIEGFQTLWNLFLSCNIDSIIFTAMNFLVYCYSNLGIEIIGERIKIWGHFFDKVFKLLHESNINKDNIMIQKLIRLLEMFISSFERKKQIVNIAVKTEANILIKNINEKNKVFIMMFNDLYRVLIVKIAEFEEVNIEDFEVLIENCSDTTKLIDICSNYEIFYRVVKDCNKINALSLIAEKKDYFNILFELADNEISPENMNPAWQLISKLNNNKETEISFLTINEDLEKRENIKNCLLSKNCFKLHYYFNYLNKIFREVKYKKEIYIKWFKDFKSFGLTLFLEILQNFVSKPITDLFQKSLLNTYMKLFHDFKLLYNENCENNQFLIDIPNNNYSELILNLIQILHYLIDYTLLRENNDLEKCSQQKYNYKCYLESQYKGAYHHYQYFPDFFENEKEICENIIQFLNEIFLFKYELIHIFYSYKDNDSLFCKAFLMSDNNDLKNILKNFVFRVILDPKIINLEELKNSKKKFGNFFFVDLLKKSKSSNFIEGKHIVYFELYQTFLSKMGGALLENYFANNFEEIFGFLIDFIVNSSIQKEILIYEYLKILQMFIKLQKNHLISRKFNLLQKLANKFLLIDNRPDLLFQIESFLNNGQIIDLVFRIINDLCVNSVEFQDELVIVLTDLMKEGAWRSNREGSWEFNPNLKQKSNTGYVGLKNLGCICYMNSVLQQLYMIPLFRKTLVEIEANHEINEDENILLPLKEIFTSLYMSKRQYISPKNLCSTFRDENGSPVCVTEQKDAFEFFSLLTEKLETYLKKSPSYQNLYKMTFEGVLSNQLICQGCPHSSERDEPFLGLNIEVKNKRNLNEGLSKLVESELLEGENAYFCDQCSKKVTTIKRAILKDLPNHLMFVLKRFEFDFDTFSKMKINDYFEFPMNLNMKPFTLENNRDDSYFMYKLSGVIIHIGIADAGHYYSIINDRYSGFDDRWIEFNDTNVKYFDRKNLGGEAFGYDEKMENVNNCNINRFKNAYILIYDRVQSNKIKKNNNCYEVKLEKSVVEHYFEENKHLLINKILFNREFFSLFEFILYDKEKQMERYQNAIDYFLFVILRAYDKSIYIYKFFIKIKELLEKNYLLALWFLKLFTNQTLFKEFLLDCPCSDIRSYMTHLISISINTIIEIERAKLMNSDSTIINFINFLISNLFNFRDFPFYITHYFQILEYIVKVNKDLTLYMLNFQILGKLFWFFIEKINEDFNYGLFDDIFNKNLKFIETDNKDIKTGGYLSLYFEKKRRSHNKTNIFANMNLEYFWVLVAKLLPFSKFEKENEFDDNYYLINSFEKELIKCEKQKIFNSMWENCNTNKGASALAKIFAFLAYNDSSFSGFLKKAYCNKIFNNTSRDGEIKFYLKGLYYFLIIEDENKKQRIEITLNKFSEQLKFKYRNSRNPKPFEIIFKFLLIVSNKNELIYNYLYENNIFEFIFGVCRDISSARITNDMTNYDKKIIKSFKKIFSKLNQRFYNFVSNKDLSLSDDSEIFYNSDSANASYEENSEILYYDKSINKWTSGRIEEKIDNLLKIKLENTAKNKPFIIIDKDSEFLKLKENQYESKNEEQVFSSNTDRGRNSEENDTSTDRSNTENNAVAY